MSEIINRRDAADRVVAILEHGSAMAAERLVRPRPSDVVWCLMTDAARVIESLPDQDRSWLSSGTRSGGWSMIGMTAAEAAEIAKVRMMAGMTPGDRLRSSPQSSDVERAMTVVDWLRYCRGGGSDFALQKAYYALACGEAITARALFRPHSTSDEMVIAREIKILASRKIIAGLRGDFAVIIADDCTIGKESHV